VIIFKRFKVPKRVPINRRHAYFRPINQRTSINTSGGICSILGGEVVLDDVQFNTTDRALHIT